jgi:hypothetical protein
MSMRYLDISDHSPRVGDTVGRLFIAPWQLAQRVARAFERHREAALGRGLINAGPEASGGHEDSGEVVTRQFVEAGGDASEVLQLVEEALDEVALAVDLAVDHAADADIALRRDMGRGAIGLDEFDNGASKEATVGDHVAGQAEPLDQLWKRRLVGSLTGCEDQAHREAVLIHDGVDLGAQSSTRTADGVIRTPFLPPAACWCARTIELSIRCKEFGERCASVSKILSHTPALAQRLNRL